MFLTPTPHHIRFVAAPPEGGESTGGTGQPPASAGTENAGDPIDWEAKYKEALGHSRDWEKKAKANKAAADELEKLKESQMSETEKAAKRTQELEAQVAAYKAKEQQADWKAQVSAETGVPADVIEGDSLEAMQSHAKRTRADPRPRMGLDVGRSGRDDHQRRRPDHRRRHRRKHPQGQGIQGLT